MSAARSRAPRRLALAVVVVLAAAVALRCGAGGPTAASEVASAAPPSLVRLIEQLDERSVELAAVPPSVRAARAAPLLREEFAALPSGALPPDWISGAGLLARARDGDAALQAGTAWVRDEEHGAGGGAAFVTRESAGLLRDLELGETAAVRVRVRMRALGGDAHAAGLHLTALEEFHGAVPPRETPNRKQRVAVSARAISPHEAWLDGARGQEWQELELYVPPLQRRVGLRVALQAGAGGALVDWVEVATVGAWERALQEPRAAEDRSRLPWRRILRCGSERADSLLLPYGARAKFDVVVPTRKPRFEAAVSLLAPPVPSASELVLRVDGVDVATHRFPARTTDAVMPFLPWTVPLERHAGRRVHLELLARGEGVGELVVGAPLLIGTPEAPPPPNLLLISIDTLRSDQLGCYGAVGAPTPNLDRLAAAGSRFARTLAASSWTLASHATVLTGHPPQVHGAEQMDRRIDPASTPLLAARLAASGFATVAFTGGGLLDPAFGFASGFDRYHTRDCGKRETGDPPATDRMLPVVDWIEEHADHPFFVFMHTYLVHDYAPDDEHLARFLPPSGVTITPRLRRGVFAPEARVGASDVPALRALYSAALAQADEQVVGRLLATLDALALADRTLVVVVSDHGEQWLEHGRLFHGEELWPELTLVPWLLRGPGVPVGAVFAEPVTHLDVAPTLLARLGLGGDAGASQLPGRDVLGAEARADLAERPILQSYQSIGPRRVDALALGPWKLVRRRPGPDVDDELLLFRVDRDPGEHDDLASREPDRVRELTRRLEHEIAACETVARALRANAPERIELDPELQRQLRELGYLQD